MKSDSLTLSSMHEKGPLPLVSRHPSPTFFAGERNLVARACSIRVQVLRFLAESSMNYDKNISLILTRYDRHCEFQTNMR